MSLYSWLMLASFIGPFALSFDKKVAFYKSWPGLFAGITLNGILFILWDGWFARTRVWGFNSQYVWDFRINDLPVEEWLFFFVVPYASVFIYACLKAYLNRAPFEKIKHHLTLLFAVFTFTLALFNSEKAYTFYNCVIASLVLTVHYLFLKKEWMGYFWMAYLLHLVPFFIVNGILTGAATTEPVVWYNDSENLGIRLYTIPLEDTVYALTCLLIPVTVMEWWLQKRHSLS
ncbi:MAG: lycopene cyclase domain-containing protein [Bacteroidota bacterium]|jgi:lycopene cyclase domain-containing protein